MEHGGVPRTPRSLNILFSLLKWNLAELFGTKAGGGGGNRTRVRMYAGKGGYMFSLLIILLPSEPTDRLA
jgi:hypothetical protein